MIILLAARASRVENQDAIDMAIINMLADPKEVLNSSLLDLTIQHIFQNGSWISSLHCQARSSITEVHFLPFNPVDKRTAITYVDSDGNWFRVSKGAPEQVGTFQSITVNLTAVTIRIQKIVIQTLIR